MSEPARWRTAAFAVLAALQLGAAGSGIAYHELTLQNGHEVWLEVAPVDPADPFRGRYVNLSYAIEQEAHPLRGEQPNYREPVYAVLEAHKGRAAEVLYVVADEPEQGLYLKVKATWASEVDRIHIDVAYDRYYMEESLAPAAETAYREAAGTRVFDDAGNLVRQGGERRPSYARMRIRNGRGVLEGILLGGVPIETAARAVRARGGR